MEIKIILDEELSRLFRRACEVSGLNPEAWSRGYIAGWIQGLFIEAVDKRLADEIRAGKWDNLPNNAEKWALDMVKNIKVEISDS